MMMQYLSTISSASTPPTTWLLCLLLSTLTFTYATAWPHDDDLDDPTNIDSNGEEIVTVSHWGDAAILTVTAWNVMVITLEVNDFRHRLATADMSTLSTNTNDNKNRLTASLIAIRYGVRDALIDWLIMYLIGYSIVAGCTWTNAEPESVVVIQGFSAIFSSVILAISSFKFPLWLGIYRRSKFTTLKDTSNLAPKAVAELTEAGSTTTLEEFRYQVRLGCGKHYSQWVYFLLPFYVDLKIWWAALSILFGLIVGYGVLFVVYKCRQRFKKHRVYVAAFAALFLSILSALFFTRGMYIVQEGWNRDIGDPKVVYTLSFFLFLIGCFIIHGLKYYEQKTLVDEEEDTEDTVRLFEDDTIRKEETTNGLLDGGTTEPHVDEDGEVLEPPNSNDLEEPLLNNEESSSSQPKVMDRYSSLTSGEGEGDFFGSAYFNRVKVRSIAPRKIYKDISSNEQEGNAQKLYQRIWYKLPFKPAWELFVWGSMNTTGCCRKSSGFSDLSTLNKLWYVVARTLKICINLLCLYVAIIACGATIQRNITKTRLPYSFEHTYKHQNEPDAAVCAYNVKCGEIQTFESKELATLSNFTVLHCGACAACSNWHDFPFQLLDLATPSRTCGQKNILYRGDEFLTRVQKCHEEDIGFSPECSWHWANNVACSKKNCAFIYIQSLMTNRVADFKVGPNSITSATCSEASCEAGPTYHFVKGVGANRRRMNVESEIKRPPAQQCKLVGLENNRNGYPDWRSFLGVTYDDDKNTVQPLPVCPEV